MTEIANTVSSYWKLVLNVDAVEKITLSKTIIRAETVVQGLKMSLGKTKRSLG